jgi:predicted aminopeptidase
MSSSTRSFRRIADQVVTDSLGAAFNELFATAVAQDSKGTWRAGTAVKAYLRAIEKRLAWLQAHSHL